MVQLQQFITNVYVSKTLEHNKTNIKKNLVRYWEEKTNWKSLFTNGFLCSSLTITPPRPHDHAMNHDDVLEQEFTWMVLIAVERFFPADQ